jgi:Flp pilus assembly pilin Flp
MLKQMVELWRDESAQDLVEYSLLLVLIALVAVASLKVVGIAISDAFNNAAANLTSAT